MTRQPSCFMVKTTRLKAQTVCQRSHLSGTNLDQSFGSTTDAHPKEAIPRVRQPVSGSSWLPDGRHVFDMRREKDWAKYANKLDGKSEPVRISDRMGESYAISPDGTKSVFGEREWTSKLWLMSDCLPDNELAMK